MISHFRILFLRTNSMLISRSKNQNRGGRFYDLHIVIYKRNFLYCIKGRCSAETPVPMCRGKKKNLNH